LSILGAITYGLTAVGSAAATMETSISKAITSGQIYVTILWVMTLGTIPSKLFIPLFLKKFQTGMSVIKTGPNLEQAFYDRPIHGNGQCFSKGRL
jgi:hypothetical protein